MPVALELVERSLLPDTLIRAGIRGLLRTRLRQQAGAGQAGPQEELNSFVAAMRRAPIAIAVDKANEQHYEVPAAFFQLVLGRHLKYSSCLWEHDVRSLDAAEAAMLRLTCDRAALADGMRILELGCGWGSLTLWMAEHYPNARVVAVSNSHPQRTFILESASRRGLHNVEIHTADMNDFSTDETFDRVVAVEMFEHMRNYASLLDRIASWLEPHGQLFVHVFCHRQYAYPFEVHDQYDWMARHFFTGGMMPSRDLLLHFQDRVTLDEQWEVSGHHYQLTANAWLENLDREQGRVLDIFARVYGKSEARRWVQRWRIFFMACAELFGYRNGTEWLVAHYRFNLQP